MIRTRALRHRYADGPALTFDDVDVSQGGVLVLRGPSGAGKSTWLALAAGLLRVQSGELQVAGQALAGMGHAALDGWRARHLGFLPQKLHLSESLTVEGNLGLVYFAAGLAVDTHTIHQTLERLGVAGLAGRRPSQLSGGQAQRVALARSVLRRPRVILADEPTASLDDEAATAALALLVECAADGGTTLVIATHDARVQTALPAAQVLRLVRVREGAAGVATAHAE